ncbi:8-oxo-dGTP diphosphatase [Haloarchaeobius amylolyticus]|uniref:8-oxo-dGTP diphosphatase n=1 Tax=Haloarchaeobius amylolyticus TaxID=1198296 RepID=UPI0022710BA5|nr:8-oxo-dGTP diphosphatase [Haloarchaeobius amylolyticus]
MDDAGADGGIDQATLCFVCEDDEVLLIEKKRGIGAGLYNGPGGKVEPGETPREAVVREVREEVHLEVSDLSRLGDITFYFGEDPLFRCHCYRTESYAGTPTETPEADPEWFRQDSVPYDQMWEDDRYWLPHLLDEESVHGRFDFDDDGDELLAYELTVGESLPAPSETPVWE